MGPLTMFCLFLVNYFTFFRKKRKIKIAESLAMTVVIANPPNAKNAYVNSIKFGRFWDAFFCLNTVKCQ